MNQKRDNEILALQPLLDGAIAAMNFINYIAAAAKYAVSSVFAAVASILGLVYNFILNTFGRAVAKLFGSEMPVSDYEFAKDNINNADMDKLLSLIFNALDQLKRSQITNDYDQENSFQINYIDQALETQKNEILEKFENFKKQATPEQKIQIIDYTVRIDNDWFFAHLHNIDWITDENYRFCKPLIVDAIYYKSYNIINFMMSFPENFLTIDMNDIALEFLKHYPHHPWATNLFESMIQNDQFFVEILFQLFYSQWLASCPKSINGYVRIIELISKYANPKNLNSTKNIPMGSILLTKKITPLASYLDFKKRFQRDNPQRFDFDIEILIKNGAKLDDKTVDGNETNCLALCESHLPDMLETINRIQLEYAHDSRWQKLLDMGALTKDVDLYIYNLVSQNPELIVENQTLKTLFCQILSQENRPHIDSIWEAYNSNVVQHPLTHIIQNFLEKRLFKAEKIYDETIMNDPLSFTAGYCHYLGKDVLFFLDNNLDERKSLLTTKLYQSKIKPNLLPPSINHSLFGQLCQNKNVSDLGQHRFDQRYGLSFLPQNIRGK